MREIKFRVPIYYGGKFSHFLYWSNEGDAIKFEPDDVLSGDRIFLTRGVREARDSEQFTGLRDKNGKEIYEGDIYKCEDEDGPQIVEYYEGYEGDSHPVQGFIFCSFFREDNVISDIEVIGNIHENPELVATA